MKVTIHSSRRVFDDFFRIDEALVSFERFDGQMSGPVRRLSFERGDSVSAIIFNRTTRNIILVNQFKFPTHRKGPGWVTETVAGMLKETEPLESAIRREILEETGYQVRALEEIATFYVSPGGSSERVSLFYAEVDDAGRTGPGGGVPEEAEDIKTVEFSLPELRRLLASGEIVDAKTIIGILWLSERFNSPE